MRQAQGQRARPDAVGGSPREAEAQIRKQATHAIGGGGGFPLRGVLREDRRRAGDREAEAGVAGAYRFTQRLFRLAENVPAAAPMPAEFSPEARTLRRATHRAIAAVTPSSPRALPCV